MVAAPRFSTLTSVNINETGDNDGRDAGQIQEILVQDAADENNRANQRSTPPSTSNEYSTNTNNDHNRPELTPSNNNDEKSKTRYLETET